MFHGSLQHYESVGNQMLDFVLKCSEIVGNPNPAILELPCGFGRVTRKLVERFNPQLIHAAEILPAALHFCVEEFKVNGYQVCDPVTEFNNIPDSFFDIAVMGSLITHLSESDSKSVMQHFFKKLKKGGVGIVTTTGIKAHDLLQNSTHYQTVVCQVGEAGRQHLLSSYESNKFGYAKYFRGHTFEQKTVEVVGDSYGYSLIPRKWIEDICVKNNLSILNHVPGGWDNHQDVFFIGK
jgi:ubiquinone/menaquinone biosynthesis C-methylase UbiE